MTVSNEVSRSTGIGNGSAVEFPFAFELLEESDLEVYTQIGGVEELVDPGDYTVDGVGESEGTVTFDTAPATDTIIVMLRVLPYTQGISISNQAALFVSQVEAALDRAAMRDQQLEEELDRKLGVGPTHDISDIDLSALEEISVIATALDDFIWVTGTVYAKNDLVVFDGVFYTCFTAHTAGTFATDLAAGKWRVLTDVTIPDLTEVTFQVPTDYATLQAAFDDVKTRVSGSTRKINIEIETGHEPTSGLFLSDGDWGNCYITYEGDGGVPGTETVSMALGWTGTTDVGLPITGNDKADNLFLFFNCKPPVLACKVDAGSAGGSGWYCAWGCSSMVLPGCGVINAGYNGFEARTGDHCIDHTIWDGAVNCGIRCAYKAQVAAQSATADNCCTSPDNDTQGAVDCSRGASIHFRLGSAQGSGACGLNIRRGCYGVIEEGNLSGAATYGAIVQHGARISGYGVTINDTVSTDAGYGYGLWLQTGFASLAGAIIKNNGGSTDIRFGDSSPYNSAAIADISGIETTAGTTAAQVLSDINLDDFNVVTNFGIAFFGSQSAVFHMGIYDVNGATDGKTFDPSSGAILRSSRTGTGTQAHQSFHNANGSVGSITTAASQTNFVTSSSRDLKANPTPADGQAALDRVLAWAVQDFSWLTYDKSEKGMKPTGEQGRGLIAEELAEVCPYMVSLGKGSPGDSDYVPAGIDYSKGVPDLILAIQTLAAKLK